MQTFHKPGHLFTPRVPRAAAGHEFRGMQKHCQNAAPSTAMRRRDTPDRSSTPRTAWARSRETAREFSRWGDLSQVVAWHAEKTKRREQKLSASGVNPVVGGNSATKISSPKGTLCPTILSFSLGVRRSFVMPYGFLYPSVPRQNERNLCRTTYSEVNADAVILSADSVSCRGESNFPQPS